MTQIVTHHQRQETTMTESIETTLEAIQRAARIAERDAWQNGLEVVELPLAEFTELLEYSTTLPTGKTIGKRWKRQLYVGPKRLAWLLGEYVEDPDPAYVAIRWREIHVDPAEQLEKLRADVLALATSWARPLNGMRQRANSGADFAEINELERVRAEHAAELRKVVRAVGGEQ